MTKEDLNMSDRELLDSLKLLKGDKLTRAAILLFHRTPDKWMAGSYTKIGKFGEGADLQYQDEVHGSLFIQAERVVDLIYLKYLKAPITYDEMTRIETYPFPKEAVREAFYNALVHSCRVTGIPIQIRIEDDAMYISNDCVFPSGWTAETLMKRHQSRPYNPAIANALGGANRQDLKHQKDVLDDVLKDALGNKVLELIGMDRKIKQTQIAKRLNVSIASVQRVMKRMVKQGKIERKGGKRYGYWEIKK